MCFENCIRLGTYSVRIADLARFLFFVQFACIRQSTVRVDVDSMICGMWAECYMIVCGLDITVG